LWTVRLTPVGVALARAAHAISQGIDGLAGEAGKLADAEQFKIAVPG
jgi:DNA-binding transcriptional LysR family regulator